MVASFSLAPILPALLLLQMWHEFLRLEIGGGYIEARLNGVLSGIDAVDRILGSSEGGATNRLRKRARNSSRDGFWDPCPFMSAMRGSSRRASEQTYPGTALRFTGR